MDILGLSCFYHDSAAALLRDGQLLAAAEEERFSRVKHDNGFPDLAVRFCLDRAGIKVPDLDYVVFYEKPFQKFDRILRMTMQAYPRSWKVFRESMIAWLGEKLWLKSILNEKLGVDPKRILFADHHLCHAASAFYASPFEEAALLTVDGVGEWTTTAAGRGSGTEIRLERELRFPHSLGLLYSAFTAFLGFQVNEGEYKVMGMAPYGVPRYVDEITRHLVEIAEDGSFRLKMDPFSFHYSEEHSFNRKFEAIFGPPRPPEMHFFTSKTRFPSYFGEKPADYQSQCKRNEHYADIAASIQRVTEEILLRLARDLHRRTGLDRLCLAGGVALNSVANGRILRETPFREMFIQPAAGDGGGALGAALHAWHGLLGKPRGFVMEHAYWGQDYGPGEIKGFLDGQGIAYEQYADEAKLQERIIDDLQDGKVVGLFQGRFEWGPRALGNRSILADPRSEEMKDLVNVKIKFREPFRPFAPVLLEDAAAEYFEGQALVRQYPARYMLMVLPFRPGMGEKVQAVNHGGTGRLQTIRREWNPRYHGLVRLFGQATGVPVLMNTSFNLRGEPIVTSPAHAYSTFSRSGIDVLMLDNFLIRKS